MKRHFRAALAMLSLVSLAGLGALPPAASAQDCATTDRVIERIRHETPDVDLRSIDGPLAARLRAGIADLIGQNVPEGGSYLIARQPDALTDYIVRFANGCATHHGRFPDRLVQAWLEGSPA
jgi:predicted small lipoprotein YifL